MHSDPGSTSSQTPDAPQPKTGLSSLIGWAFSRSEEARPSAISAGLEAQIQSLESKLAFTEVFSIEHQGPSPLFLRACRVSCSEAALPERDAMGSIAGLAFRRLREMINESTSPAEIRRLCLALRFDPERAEEVVALRSRGETLQPPPNRSLPDDTQPAESGPAHAVSADEQIKSKMENARHLRFLENEYAVFSTAFPGGPTSIHTKVSLELNAESNQYRVVLQCDSLKAWRLLTKNRVVFPEPFNPIQLEEEYGKFFDSLTVKA